MTLRCSQWDLIRCESDLCLLTWSSYILDRDRLYQSQFRQEKVCAVKLPLQHMCVCGVEQNVCMSFPFYFMHVSY